MAEDWTEGPRREMVREMPEHLQRVIAEGGDVWTTERMRDDFEVTGFMAPFVVVRRKSDGKRGTLMFTHHPRFYFDWQGEDD